MSHSLTRTEIGKKTTSASSPVGAAEHRPSAKAWGHRVSRASPQGPAPGGRVLSVLLRLKPDLFTYVFVRWGLTAAHAGPCSVVTRELLLPPVRSSSLTRDRTLTPALEAQSLSHWTTREVP